MSAYTHYGSVRGVVSLGSVGPAALWLAVHSSIVLTSTIGSLDSSFLQDGETDNLGEMATDEVISFWNGVRLRESDLEGRTVDGSSSRSQSEN